MIFGKKKKKKRTVSEILVTLNLYDIIISTFSFMYKTNKFYIM